MIEFDFERDVLQMLPAVQKENDSLSNFKFNPGGSTYEQKHRIIVCRHWLLGLCHNGENCSYLHRLDKSRMPPCKHGKLCKIKNCPLKHVAEEELEECMFYKQGFCYNGPKCGRRHVKRTPEECPQEVTFEPVANAANMSTGGVKKLKTAEKNENYKVTLCTHWLMNGTCPFNEDCHFAHGEDQINEGYQPNVEFLQDNDIYDPTHRRLDCALNLPFPTNARCSYFILQSPDLRALEIAKRRQVWAVPMRIAAEMNAAFKSAQHVILYMCCRPLRGIYGVARMAEPIPPQTHMNVPISPEFKIQWLRTLRISLRTVAQLKLGMSGMFVGRSSSDGRFENKVGMDILLTAYRKPVWNWTQEMQKAESNIRLLDPMKGGAGGAVGGGTALGEYYPESGIPAYYLPPDELFSADWVARAGLAVNVERPMSNYGGRQSGNHAANVPDFYKGNQPGFIFNAPPPVIEEMFRKKLFGLPPQMQGVEIHPGVPLFIFDAMNRVLLGIFHAESQVGFNIDSTAFTGMGLGPGGGSPLPIQLRFRVALEVAPMPIQNDAELMRALGMFAQNMGGPLGPAETRNVANIMARRAAAAQMQGGGRGGGRGGAGAGGNYYKPPFPNVATVPVDIAAPTPEVKRRILGPNASNIMGIVDELGSKNTIRIRLRGRGSGFTEGPQHQELPEPLHFNVSAESQSLLETVAIRVKELIERVKQGMEGGY